MLTDLDRRVRASVEDELRRLSRRLPLPDRVAGELRRSLDRIGDRLVLEPVRDYAAHHPERRRVIGSLFGADADGHSEGR
jgi:hypothetical protein